MSNDQPPYDEQSQEPNQQSTPTHHMVRRHFAQGKTRMIRKLLAIGYQMGFDKPQNDTEQYRMKRSDVNKLHVNRWLLSEKSAVRKEMDEMTHKELSKAVTQFEQVYKDYLTRI